MKKDYGMNQNILQSQGQSRAENAYTNIMNPLLSHHSNNQASVDALTKRVFAPLPRCASYETKKNRLELQT